MEEGVMLNRGWMITKYYSETVIEEKIKELIQICASQNDDDTFLKLNSYLRMKESSLYEKQHLYTRSVYGLKIWYL